MNKRPGLPLYQHRVSVALQTRPHNTSPANVHCTVVTETWWCWTLQHATGCTTCSVSYRLNSSIKRKKRRCRIVVLPLAVETCQVTVSHFSVFLKFKFVRCLDPAISASAGSLEQWKPSSTIFSLDCFDDGEMPALKAVNALLYNVTVC